MRVHTYFVSRTEDFGARHVCEQEALYQQWVMHQSPAVLDEAMQRMMGPRRIQEVETRACIECFKTSSKTSLPRRRTMSNISISSARREQVDSAVKSFLSAFDRPIGPDPTREQFTAIFSPQIQWRDHAFLVRRVGREAVLGLHKAWLHCNQPFRTELKVCRSSHPVLPFGENSLILAGDTLYSCWLCG